MRELPKEFSVVSDVEFEVLRHLPEFELTDADTLRRQVGEQFFFVMRESEWIRTEAIAAGVDAEIQAMDKARAENQAQAAAELQQPKVEVKPEVESETKVQPQYWRFPSDRFRGFSEN